MATKTPPSWQKRIDALREKLARLRESGTRVFLPPLTAKQLAAIEKKLGVELADDHRAFLTQVTAGEEETGTAPLLPPQRALAELPGGARPSARFPASNAAATKLVRAAGTLDAPWDGVLPIRDHGDGELDVVVVAGPQRGWVWKGWDEGFTPLGRTFLDVVEEHVDASLAAMRPAISAAATEIDLTGEGLTAIPAEVFSAKRLRRLLLANNALTALPEALGELGELRELYLDGCPLTELPAAIGRLRKLTVLSAAGTKLAVLPEAIGELPALEKLVVSGAALTALPASLGNLGALAELQIHANPLTSLPAGLVRTAVTALRLEGMPGLDAAQAVEIASRMSRLRTLVIKGPVAKAPTGLDRLGQLETLLLIKLGLTDVPAGVSSLPALASLGLDQNQLTSLPDELGTMRALRSLVLFRNPLDRAEVARRRAAWPHLKISF